MMKKYLTVFAMMLLSLCACSDNEAEDVKKPEAPSITNNTYPYISEIYAAVRADIDKTSVAYQLYELMTSKAGQDIVEESGYVPM